MTRKKIVAGNWKMNLAVKESQTLAQEISSLIVPIEKDPLLRILIAPTYTNLYPVYNLTKLDAKLEIAAQNMHQAKNGAYTGEISAEMLKSIGIKTVILGHSERRQYFNENNKDLSEKVTTALDNNMDVIFCIGEQLEDRKSGKHFDLVKKQIQEGLFHLKSSQWQSIILAYEPVWAIGTGETASPEQAQEMHSFIRQLINDQYDEKTAQQVSILYGGSVKPANAAEIFSQPDVDGGLIGGASLKAEDFVAIIKHIL